MSVIKRLNLLVRSNLTDLTLRGSGRELLLDAGENVREARRQQAETRISERRLGNEYERLLDQSSEWEARAELALRAGDETLARRALGRKYAVDRRSDLIKKQLDEQRAHLVDLERSLAAVRVKLEGLREHGRAGASSADTQLVEPNRTPMLSPRLEVEAELGLLGEAELFDQFHDVSDRLSMEGAIDREKANMSSLAGAPKGTDLEARFRALEAERSLDQIKRTHGNAPLHDLRRRLDEE